VHFIKSLIISSNESKEGREGGKEDAWFKAAVSAKLSRKRAGHTQAEEPIAVMFANTEDDITFVVTSALRWRCDPSNECVAGGIAEG